MNPGRHVVSVSKAKNIAMVIYINKNEDGTKSSATKFEPLVQGANCYRRIFRKAGAL